MNRKQNLQSISPQIAESWERFRTKWSRCFACPLSQERTKVVLFRGELPCNLLLVGEAPGESENVGGFPFDGPAGDMLNTILEEAETAHIAKGGRHVTIGITNVICCIPWKTTETSISIRKPSGPEIKACNPRLLEFIALANPRLLVALGDVSKPSVIKIGNSQSPAIHTGSIIHPSAILRQKGPAADLSIKRSIIAVTRYLQVCESNNA